MKFDYKCTYIYVCARACVYVFDLCILKSSLLRKQLSLK